MQLLVLGLALGLPSIDAECLAAIALMRLTFGHDSDRWTLRACASMTDDLPLLVDDDSTFSGFSSISNHLAENNSRPSTIQRAHGIAVTALIQSRAPPLISAYLYVSSENYHGATRGAFTPILSPLSRLLLPPALRAAARDNTAHLGLSTRDLDSPHEDHRLDGVDSSFEAASKHRASLILPSKATVQDLLANKAKGADTFRLHALADALLAPLQEMLAENQWLSSTTNPGHTDCLAYGYLCIMYEARMPNSWLRNILDSRYPVLAAYITRLKNELGLARDTRMSQSGGSTSETEAALDGTLPWEKSSTSSLVESTHISHLLRSFLPALQTPAIAQLETSGSTYTSGVLTALGACALSAIGGAFVLLRHLYNTKHGEHVQIFGRQQAASLDHLSQALAGLGSGFQQSPNANSLDISPSNTEHPLTEVSVEGRSSE